VTFFRSMGGTIGAAIFLSILFDRLPSKIQTAYAAVAHTRAFQSAAAAHPDQVRQLAQTSSGGGSVQDTSFLNHLASALSHPFKVGFAQSTTIVYYIAAAIMVLTLIITFLLPELPLSSQSAVERRQQERIADSGTDESPGQSREEAIAETAQEIVAEAADTSGLPAAAAVAEADDSVPNGHVDAPDTARTVARRD